MSFEVAINRLLAHEGGYIWHKSDPGGETNWGISKRAYPKINIKTLTRDQAAAIYRRDYWNAVKGDELPPAVAFQAFDSAVNHGQGQAIRWLQRAVGVADDGKFGPVTLGAVKCANAADLILKFNAERLLFYCNLSTFGTFGKGWVRRVAANLKHASEDN